MGVRRHLVVKRRQCSDDMDEREDSVTPENVNSSEPLDYDGNVYGRDLSGLPSDLLTA
jgi:hypothetical protein